MRIGGGRLRGRGIRTPKGASTRPTSGRLRKALFDIIAPELPGARVLDLFAGAGSLGLEALSRGASWVTFVERARSAVRAIEDNVTRLGLAGQTEVVTGEVRSALNALTKRGDRFHLVLLDPPYRADMHDRVLSDIDRLGLLAPGGAVVIEHHHKRALRERYGGLRMARQVRAGESCLTFYRAGDSEKGA